jgi:hypothetical protein
MKISSVRCMRVWRINLNALFCWFTFKGFLWLTTELLRVSTKTLLQAVNFFSHGLMRSLRVELHDANVLRTCNVAHVSWSAVRLQCMHYAQYWSLLHRDKFAVRRELQPAQCVCLQRALLLGITWQWTLWETFQRGTTPACLMLVVESRAINKRGMCFKVIDSPYQVEVLSPKVEANTGKLHCWQQQWRGKKSGLVSKSWQL